MIIDIPATRVCPRCDVEKKAEEFRKDSSRADGLSFYCGLCMSTYVPKGSPKRNLAEITKRCITCHRDRPGTMFAYASTDDGLRDKCRTCNSWKQRGTHPSIDDVLAFEERLNGIIRSATVTLMSRYKKPAQRVLVEHRGEFEQTVWVKMHSTGLTKLWKLPVWMHNTSKI